MRSICYTVFLFCLYGIVVHFVLNANEEWFSTKRKTKLAREYFHLFGSHMIVSSVFAYCIHSDKFNTVRTCIQLPMHSCKNVYSFGLEPIIELVNT